MVDSLASLSTETPNIAVDLEGRELGRHGDIYIAIVHVCQHQWTYLVDVHRLQRRAFTTFGKEKRVNLQSILESPNIPKLF
jgi:hypothetical protein